MKRSSLLLCAVAGAPLIVSAQTARVMPAAADSNAPVPSLQYRSVFAGYAASKEPRQSPDKTWAQSNRTVAGDIVPLDAAPTAASAPAQPPQPPQPRHRSHQDNPISRRGR
jgi:hypothetical protein